MTRKKVILITGPTASGKTALAVSLAQKLNTSIISADSRQCFVEMNIGVAKPSRQELNAVKHYFINSHSIHDHVNAGTFESYALKAANGIFESNDSLVMAGGTGLYIRAFCEGLDDIPAVSGGIREEIIDEYKQKGLEWLQNQVAVHDPEYFKTGEIRNPQRLMRVLEVKLSTGHPIRSFQQKNSVKRDFDIIKYALEVPRPELNNTINKRVDHMMELGLEEEVRSLVPFKELNALQTVGYSELFEYFEGVISRETAVERIKINTRHYAKRQMTWFKKDPGIRWIRKESEIIL